MKQLCKPTREQRKLIQSQLMNPADWMVERDTPTEMVLVHKHFNGTRRIIHKEEKYDD